MSSENIKQEEFIVTARKWRPQLFDSVVGQEHITVTLQNAIRNNRIHHALMFSGPRGVGKTTTARIYARAVNCTNPVNFEPCNECESCRTILEGRSMDVIEIDGASNNSVDDIRSLRDNSKYPPINGRYKIYVIDEVHMLSTSAFNALLKTLEEPPPHLLFVFATTESHKVPATIISRCQRFDFRRMELESIVNQLRFIAQNENIIIDDQSLLTIAKKGDGSMRDSQSIFDQVIAFCGKNVDYTQMTDALHLIDEEFYFKVSYAIFTKNVAEMFSLAQLVITKGYDFQETLHGLMEHFRNIMAIKATGNPNMVDTSQSFIERYEKEAKAYSHTDLLRIMNILNSTEQSLKFAPQPRIKFELALINLASLDSSVDLKILLEEIKKFKSNPQVLARQSSLENTQVIKDAQVQYSAPINSGTQTKEAIKQAPEKVLTWDSFLNSEIFQLKGLDGLKTKTVRITANEIILEFDKKFNHDFALTKKDALTDSVREYFNKNYLIVLTLGDSTKVNQKEESNTQDDAKNTNNDIFNNSIKEKTSIKKRDSLKQSLEGKHEAEIFVIKNFGAFETNLY